MTIAAPKPTEMDPLSALDELLAGVAGREDETDARAARRANTRDQFKTSFEEACEREVRPAMETVIARLEARGGGGVIERHAGGEARFGSPSLIAWMSLRGAVVGEPRPDREAYLRIEADVDAGEVRVFEGDMWRGAGGNRSGRAGTWHVADLTGERILSELVEIVRRAAQ
jgi:hypothetical protein